MKVYFCSEENQLIDQIGDDEKLKIESIKVVGYLDEQDYELLTEMSSEGGSLREVDLTEVENNGYRSEMGSFIEGVTSLADGAFFDSVVLERLLLPEHLDILGDGAVSGCDNLREIDLPEKAAIYGLQCCNGLTDIFLPVNFQALMDWDYYGCYSLVGSGENYICERDGWIFNDKGVCVFEGEDDSDGMAFTSDGVLFVAEEKWPNSVGPVMPCAERHYTHVSLVRYPGNNRRRQYATPQGVNVLMQHAFCNCSYLRTLFLQGVNELHSHCICNCSALETLVIAGRQLEGGRSNPWEASYSWAIHDCPRLQDIYLFYEDPAKVDAGLFTNLQNLSDIVLHVPCFSARKYYDADAHDSFDNMIEKPWRKFKSIVEFDPIDVFPELVSK